MFTVVCWTEICDMSWTWKLGNQWYPLVSVVCPHLIVIYLLGKVLPPGNKPAGTEDLKDLGGKTKQQLPRCPAPMVQELPAQVSSGMRAGSTPALFGKGTPWGHGLPTGDWPSSTGNVIKQWNIYKIFMFKVLCCSCRCFWWVCIPQQWSRGLLQM